MSKSLLTVLFFVFYNSIASATTYYVSSGGSDSNNGTSQATAWKTLNKVNSVTFSAGDHILFRDGDTFYGSITIKQSGTSTNPIVFGNYGSGAKPVISGFTNVSLWTNLGSNIWESTSAVSTLSTCNIVLINGVNTAMGRMPNSGYLTYQSASGTSSITSSSLNSGVTNWTGAQIVVRKYDYVTDRCNITSASGSTLNFTSTDGYNCQAGFGFYIENDVRTLDTQNEWYYNPSTKKIRIYSTSQPANVQVSTKDTLVTIIGLLNDVIFDGITFSGANQDIFTVRSAQNISIQNCTLSYSGKDGIWGGQNGGANSTGFVVQNNNIDHINNNAITLESEFVGTHISGNNITNIGMNDGMGGDGSGNYGTLYGIQAYASGILIHNNTLKNVGYNGIAFHGNNIEVYNNMVDTFCIVKQDGGGIYSYTGDGSHPFSGQKVYNNIVQHGLGATLGTTAVADAHGIYMDDGTANVEIYGNTCANNSLSGIYLHNNYNTNVHDNTSFNNDGEQVYVVSSQSSYPCRLLNIKHNIFISKASTQIAGYFLTTLNDIASFGTIDSNYYARPIDDSLTMKTEVGGTGVNRTLAGWQSYSGYDAHSLGTPKTITDVNDLRFDYNATTSNKTIGLDANYIDVAGNPYYGSITLASFTSSVLIKDTSLFAMVNSLNIISDITRVAAYPNPFASSIKVSITGKPGPFNLSLVDALGRILWTKSRSKNTGTYQEIINTSSIGKGIYFLRVTLNNKSSIIKLVK
jgi:hypothetical protein